MHKFWKFADVSESDWIDWKWQLQHRLKNTSNIRDFFPNLSEEKVAAFEAYRQNYNLAVTPYTLSLIELDQDQNPVENDPIWQQFRFYGPDEMGQSFDYDGESENWENPAEMPSKILQHKYPGRAIIRILNTCFGFCNYCYLTARMLDKEAGKVRLGNPKEWEKSLNYLRSHPEVTDVLLSGGEPLLLDNDKLEQVLSDLRSIPSIQTIRLNTRVLTFNPYRFDSGLALLFKRYQLTALEIHAVHPREFTPAVDQALACMDEAGHRPLILWRAPLLRGINADPAILKELFLKLYARRITPYYIFHYTPFTLGRSVYGLSIREGAEMLRTLRRSIPGAAFPRYTLFHLEGKQDIPLEPEGSAHFQYIQDEGGNQMVRFKNWRNNWVTYPDIQMALYE